MTFYNAIILDEERKIVGRTHITNLSRFSSPSSKWIAYHEGGRLTDKFPTKLIGPHNPIAIVQPYRSGGQFQVNVETLLLDRKPIPFQVTAETTVEQLKAMIESKEGISPVLQRLLFRGHQLNDDKFLVDCKIRDGDTLLYVMRLLGGGGMHIMLDLQGKTVTGSGKTMDPWDKDFWKGYSFGLNIIGKCDNGDCKSNKIGHPPILRRRLSYCRFTGVDEPFKCPACERKTFKPTNFLVAGARSAINFRKSGEIQIKSTLLESPGPFPEYAMFAESNDTVEYDEIEVKTTHLDRSPFFCNLCSTFIMRRSLEAGRACGHYFHEACARKFKDCPICNAELLMDEAVEKLFEL